MDNLELNDKILAFVICSLQKSWQSGKCKEKADRKRVWNCSARWTNLNKRHLNADIWKAKEPATSWAILEKWATSFCETMNSRKDLGGCWGSIKQKELWVTSWSRSEQILSPHTTGEIAIRLKERGKPHRLQRRQEWVLERKRKMFYRKKKSFQSIKRKIEWWLDYNSSLRRKSHTLEGSLVKKEKA